jgi:DNA-binding PadR family transcriptional regulator
MSVLEKQGLIAGDWGDPNKRSIRIYRLTETGKKEVVRLNSIVRPKLEEAIEVMQQVARELASMDEEDGGYI